MRKSPWCRCRGATPQWFTPGPARQRLECGPPRAVRATRFLPSRLPEQTPGGEFKTVVLMVRDDLDDPTIDMGNIAVFLHEIGHVNDFERGKTLVVGKPPDVRKAELYAHDYACRRMMRENCRASMAAYINILTNQIAKSQNVFARDAAFPSSLWSECPSTSWLKFSTFRWTRSPFKT